MFRDNRMQINNNFKSKLSGGLHIVFENEGASVGTTVASSSAPMVATGGKAFPPLKDVYTIHTGQPKLHKNIFKKQKSKI